MSKLTRTLAIVVLITCSSSALATSFWKTGTIVRVLTDKTLYGGCMIQLSSNIGNGCPDNGWVSLDCKGIYSEPSDGKRAYVTALLAFQMGKQVSVFVNNEEKNNDYCVARRVDIIN